MYFHMHWVILMIEGSGNHCKYGDQDGVIIVIYLVYSALKYAMETVIIIPYNIMKFSIDA